MRHLAIDIGAESGRAIVGEILGGRLQCREIHRFPNEPLKLNGSLHWDIGALESNVFESIRLAGHICSVGIDTWGVDYVLLDASGQPLSPPFHYRDSRTEGLMERAFSFVAKEKIYRHTGIQFLRFNTLYQLLAEDPVHLEKASMLLTVPDYLHFALCDRDLKAARSERTIASTTQMLSPSGSWAADLLDRLGLSSVNPLLPEVVGPGTDLGEFEGAKVVTPASHDTASAVACANSSPGTVWISSGTWSIMGITAAMPNLSEGACDAGFTNEGAAGGGFRFCKNVMGLWILQECRRRWKSEGMDLSYEEIVQMAEVSSGSRCFDVSDDSLLAAGPDMPERVNRLVLAAGEQPAQTPGEFTRAILQSLAVAYAGVLGQLEMLVGRKFEEICIVGGGCQNRLLNRLTAEACGLPVVAGPVEATAIGNLLAQMVACGEIESFEQGRELLSTQQSTSKHLTPNR